MNQCSMKCRWPKLKVIGASHDTKPLNQSCVKAGSAPLPVPSRLKRANASSLWQTAIWKASQAVPTQLTIVRLRSQQKDSATTMLSPAGLRHIHTRCEDLRQVTLNTGALIQLSLRGLGPTAVTSCKNICFWTRKHVGKQKDTRAMGKPV